MRVLLLNSSYETRFTDHGMLLDRYDTLTGWSEALLNAGASSVTVLQPFVRDARTRRNGIEYVFRSIGRAGWPWTLRRALAEHAPDLVHVNGLIFSWPAWCLGKLRLGKLRGRPAIVMQDHGGAEPSRRPFGWISQKLGTNAADAFLFSAAELAAPWRAAGLIGPDQSVHAVMESSTRMLPVERKEAVARSGVGGRPAVLWVGRLNANKDPLTVLDGFERALPRLPDAELTMLYGSEDWLPQVKERIGRSSSLATRVHLRGRVEHDDIASFYGAADLFVLGSRQEGSGYSLIEALACGVTPVVTDIPSFRQLTGNGTIGALWPAGDSEALSRALAAYSAYNFVSARPAVLEHFDRELSWPVIGRRAMAVYGEVLAQVASKQDR